MDGGAQREVVLRLLREPSAPIFRLGWKARIMLKQRNAEGQRSKILHGNAEKSGQHAEQPPAKRRGPKPAISDQALWWLESKPLEASPWEGEGYRNAPGRDNKPRD